jgi:glutamate:GABA antiporter
VLALVGFIATATTIVLSLFPGADQPNKVLAVVKVAGATLIQLGLGIAIFVAERRRARRDTVIA